MGKKCNQQRPTREDSLNKIRNRIIKEEYAAVKKLKFIQLLKDVYDILQSFKKA